MSHRINIINLTFFKKVNKNQLILQWKWRIMLTLPIFTWLHISWWKMQRQSSEGLPLNLRMVQCCFLALKVTWTFFCSSLIQSLHLLIYVICGYGHPMTFLKLKGFLVFFKINFKYHTLKPKNNALVPQLKVKYVDFWSK